VAENVQIGGFYAIRWIFIFEEYMITPAQCRAARGLIEMTQKQLAEESCVSLRSIQGFEAGSRPLQSLALSAIVRVLEDKGIVMLLDECWIGVKLRTDIGRK
jgi:transcriptional regulator with XRE-family HTH domain